VGAVGSISAIEEAPTLSAMAGPCGHRHALIGIDFIDLLDEVHRVAQESLQAGKEIVL